MYTMNYQETHPQIYHLFKEKECVLLSFTKTSEKIKYVCKCGIEKQKLLHDFFRKNCRTCREKKLKEIPKKLPEVVDENMDQEIWIPIKGGYISNFGNAKNALNQSLKLCQTKFRFHIGGKNQYASRLVAIAFKIENYEKLDDDSYVVTHIDDNKQNNHVDNLKIITKSEVNKKNGQKSRKSDLFFEKNSWAENQFENFEKKIIPELPTHVIYKNGEIWNGSRFLTFGLSENYLRLCLPTKNLKVHRLICYAFHPINGKNTLNDYSDLQVNHKDGNTINNHADNLEWVTSRENMFHCYSQKLNKNVRCVLQFSLDGIFIKEFMSIAEASRQTGEPEHRIRSSVNGKFNSMNQYLWKFNN